MYAAPVSTPHVESQAASKYPMLLCGRRGGCQVLPHPILIGVLRAAWEETGFNFAPNLLNHVSHQPLFLLVFGMIEPFKFLAVGFGCFLGQVKVPQPP